MPLHGMMHSAVIDSQASTYLHLLGRTQFLTLLLFGGQFIYHTWTACQNRTDFELGL